MKKHVLTFFHIISFFVLLYLGFWQIERLKWKNDVINLYKHNINQKITPLPIKINQEQDQFRTFELEGAFDYKNSLLMFTSHNNKAGYYVYSPFKTNDNKNIIINQGWISKENENFLKSIDSNHSTKITGIILKQPKQNFFTPNSDYKNRIITSLNLNEISSQFGIKFENYYIIQQNNHKKEFTPFKFKDDFHNFHLTYAITWFTLAFVSIIFLFLMLFPRKAKISTSNK